MHKSKLLSNFLRNHVKKGGTYIPPFSSGKDGYELKFNKNTVYLSNKDIHFAEEWARGFILSFKIGNNLWYHPKAEIIRQNEFDDFINRQLNK